jgi:hypothetical protein
MGSGRIQKPSRRTSISQKKKKKFKADKQITGKPDNRTDNPRPKKRPNDKQNPQEEGTSLVKKEQARGDQAGS